MEKKNKGEWGIASINEYTILSPKLRRSKKLVPKRIRSLILLGSNGKSGPQQKKTKEPTRLRDPPNPVLGMIGRILG